jgi:16S rRNA processing protein RimM
VLIGEIGRPQGLKGALRLRSYAGDPGAIAGYGPLQDEAATRSFEIESVRADAKSLVVHIKGVASREAAAALTGTRLYLPRTRLPAAGEEEWYHADLVGLDALDAAGAKFGRVIAVHNFGAGDLIEVAPAEGGATLLIPFTSEAVPEVDVEGGWLKIVPPELIE